MVFGKLCGTSSSLNYETVFSVLMTLWQMYIDNLGSSNSQQAANKRSETVLL